MKKFLAIYIGTTPNSPDSRWSKLDEAKRKELQQSGIKAWGSWMAANQRAIVEARWPLGKTMLASPHGISDVRNALTGYVIVQAESHDAAAKLFENHPHFTIFPGDSVEIMECLPIPG